MDEYLEIRKLLRTGKLPDKSEREMMKSYQGICPPEARHVAAFRVISNSLHITQEVTRDRLFATTPSGDLSREDKRVIKSYNDLLDYQMTQPKARGMMPLLEPVEQQSITQKSKNQQPITQKSAHQSHTQKSDNQQWITQKSEYKPSITQKSENHQQSTTQKSEDSSCLDQNPAGRKSMIVSILGNYGSSKHKPHYKLRITKETIAKLQNEAANNRHKANILKNVFRRSSDIALEPRRPSKIMLKSCFVKVFRINTKQLKNLNARRNQNQRKSVTFDFSNTAAQRFPRQKTPAPTFQPKLKAILVNRCSQSLAKVDQELNKTTPNSRLPSSLKVSSQSQLEQYSRINKPLEIHVPDQVLPVSEVGHLPLLAVQSSSSVTSTYSEHKQHCPSMSNNTEQHRSSIFSPKIQEFSIFDVTSTPKKPHKRPLIYNEHYRRRLTEDRRTSGSAEIFKPHEKTRTKLQFDRRLSENKKPRPDAENFDRHDKVKTLEKAHDIASQSHTDTVNQSCDTEKTLVGANTPYDVANSHEISSVAITNHAKTLEDNYNTALRVQFDTNSQENVNKWPIYGYNQEPTFDIFGLDLQPISCDQDKNQPISCDQDKPRDKSQPIIVDVSEPDSTTEENDHNINVDKTKSSNVIGHEKFSEEMSATSPVRNKYWRKSSNKESNGANIEGNGKQNGRNTASDNGIKNFRIPVSYHTAAALARKVSAENIALTKELNARRHDSYHCHNFGNQEISSVLEDKSDQYYMRTDRCYGGSSVVTDVSSNPQSPWSRLSKHDFPMHLQPNFAPTPEFPPPDPGYRSNSPLRFSFGATSNYFGFPDITSGPDKFSSELTTFNLISDAITQGGSSPNDSNYQRHGHHGESPIRSSYTCELD